MKTSKRLKVLTLILVIILITVLAFLGVYNISKINGDNLVKDYTVGMELKGKKILRLKVDDTVNEVTYDSEGNVVETPKYDLDENGNIVDENGKVVEEGEDEHDHEHEDYTTKEEPVNSPDILTKENYNKAKQIIEKRMNSLEVEEYTIRLNEEDGTIEIELIDNDLVNYVITAVSSQGNFRVVDDETNEVLLDRSLLKAAKVVYSTDSSAKTTAYLDLEFNKDGAKKLEDISKTYIKTTEQVVNDEGETEDKSVEKKVAVKVDDNSIIATYFNEPLTSGHLYISVGQATNDSKQLQGSALQASMYASIIKSKTIPIAYTIETNDYVVTNTNKAIIPFVAFINLSIEAITLIVIFRFKGLFATILQIGYVALLLLIVRYTNVCITLEGLFAIVISSWINVAFMYGVLRNKDNIEKAINDNLKKFISASVPILIIAIVFCFTKLLEINSFGMVMFWGYVVSLLYNILFTKGILKNTL